MKWAAQTLKGGNNETGGANIEGGKKWYLCIHREQVD